MVAGGAALLVLPIESTPATRGTTSFRRLLPFVSAAVGGAAGAAGVVAAAPTVSVPAGLADCGLSVEVAVSGVTGEVAVTVGATRAFPFAGALTNGSTQFVPVRGVAVTGAPVGLAVTGAAGAAAVEGRVKGVAVTGWANGVAVT